MNPKTREVLPPPTQGSQLSIKVVGSTESGGGSCFLVEDGTNRMVFDCGASPQESVAFQYRIAKECFEAQPDKIVISHGHFDHWGSLPAIARFYAQQRVAFPSILATKTTFRLIRRHLEKNVSLPPFDHHHKSKNIWLLQNKHSIPGSAGIVYTGSHNILYTGDFYGFSDLDDLPEIDLLIVDSTGAMRDEPRPDNESLIRQNIVKLAEQTLEKSADANVYVALFSTQLTRAEHLEREAKRITKFPSAISGKSLEESLDAYREDRDPYRSKRIVLITGVWAQGEGDVFGEDHSTLVRMSYVTHPKRVLKPGDLVILSASIPVWQPHLTSNIRAMCERLRKLGVRVVVDTSAPEEWTSFGVERMEVHSGGHGNLPEITSVIDQIRPRICLPTHGSKDACLRVADYCKSKGISVVSASQGSIITI